MLRIIKFAFITLNRWVEAVRCYLGKLKILQAHMKQMKTESEEMETTFMNNIYQTMLLISKCTLLDNFICMLKLENHRLSMELLKEMS